MAKKVNGKWDFSDMKESFERIRNMTDDELDARIKEEEERSKMEIKKEEELEKQGKIKWVW